jgi:hypothetical protein
MAETVDELIRRMHREAVERLPPPPEVKRPTVHYTQLSEAKPGDPLYLEWNTYRREVALWLAEGQKGKWVLIKGETVVGLYDTFDAAWAEGCKRYLLTPMLVHQIQSEEPIYRVRG